MDDSSAGNGTFISLAPQAHTLHKMLPAHATLLGGIVLRTMAIYLVVLIGVRLSGKREKSAR